MPYGQNVVGDISDRGFILVNDTEYTSGNMQVIPKDATQLIENNGEDSDYTFAPNSPMYDEVSGKILSNTIGAQYQVRLTFEVAASVNRGEFRVVASIDAPGVKYL